MNPTDEQIHSHAISAVTGEERMVNYIRGAQWSRDLCTAEHERITEALHRERIELLEERDKLREKVAVLEAEVAKVKNAVDSQAGSLQNP